MEFGQSSKLLLLLVIGAAGSKLDDDLVSIQKIDVASVNRDKVADFQKEWKEKPIARVISMLKDMQAQLEYEAKNDQELYDKMVCWCETNDKEKTKAIADSMQLIKKLEADIKENAALASTRETEMATLEKEKAELTTALSEAAALRAKENGEFNDQQKELLSSIGSLTGAVQKLSKHNGGASAALLQKTLMQVSPGLKRHVGLAMEAVAPHMRAQVRSLILEPTRAVSLLQQSQPVGGGESYAPQSGAIFGILSQMKETFEGNLETGKKNEAQSVSDYEGIKATKESQLKAAEDLFFAKSGELAQAKENVANADESKEDTEKQLAADEAFLEKLKAQCTDLDAQWAARSKVRSEEIVAVGETLAILTDRESHDAMSAAGQFMQLRMESRQQVRARVATAEFLAEWGKKHDSPRISMLAAKVRNDVFAKVKESIANLGEVLLDEQSDEVTKKDGCVDDFNTNEKQTGERNEHKDDVETEITQLQTDIDAKNEEEAELREKIAQAQIELKKAGENRQKENKDFQQTVADQRAAQTILEKAKQRMMEFYGIILLQRASGQKRQEPPAEFGEYKKGGGSAIIRMLAEIIAESVDVEKDALAAENEAQQFYEDSVKSTNKVITAMAKRVADDEAIEAEEVEREVFDEGDKRATVGDILKLGEVSKTLHGACDYTVNNFDERQSKRSQEMEALKQSIAIFSGASFGR